MAELERVAGLVRQDPAWQEKFASVRSEQAWIDLGVEAARSHGVEASRAEVESYLKSRVKADGDRELSVAELAAVSGGSDGNFDTNY